AVANRLVLADALEDPGSARVVAVGLAVVGQGRVESLRREPDTDQAVRRSPAVAPDTAEFAGGSVGVLAAFRFPGSGPAPAAELDQVRTFRIDGGDPVEPVAAEVHQAATGGEVAFQGVEHLPRPVLGVAAGNEDLVAIEQRLTVGVDVFV